MNGRTALSLDNEEQQLLVLLETYERHDEEPELEEDNS